MDLTRKLAGFMAAAVALFVLCPIPLLLLDGLQADGVLKITEDMAGGLGVAVLLVFVAFGVAVLIFCDRPLSKYEYLEKEKIALQYGVQGITRKNKEAFSRRHTICVAAGTVLCILAVVPMIVTAGLNTSGTVMSYSVCVLLGVIAAAVFLFVWAGSIQDSYDKLLQEGDYTVEKKRAKKKLSFFPGVYWCTVVLIFFSVCFINEEWELAGIIWPVAALLYVVMLRILKAIVCRDSSKQ